MCEFILMNRFLSQQWQINARAVGSWFLLMVGIFLWVPPVYRLLTSQHFPRATLSSQLLKTGKSSGGLTAKQLGHEESQRIAIK